MGSLRIDSVVCEFDQSDILQDVRKEMERPKEIALLRIDDDNA